jgi:hypothetical protein
VSGLVDADPEAPPGGVVSAGAISPGVLNNTPGDIGSERTLCEREDSQRGRVLSSRRATGR